jgi:hypothetical protein
MNWPTDEQIYQMAYDNCEKHDGMVLYEELELEIQKIKDAIEWLKELPS